MDLIGTNIWTQFKSIINDANDTFAQQSVIWKRSKGGLDRNGEDNLTERFDLITIKGLFDYNYIRKWPITNVTNTGELDRQTEVLILNKKYLRDLGYLSANGNFNYNFASDRFIHNNITYKSFGDTDLSQAYDEPLLIMLVLQRDDIPSGTNPV